MTRGDRLFLGLGVVLIVAAALGVFVGVTWAGS